MKFRHGVIFTLSLMLSAAFAPAYAQTDTQVETQTGVHQLDIQAQPLSGALKALADQTGVQVVFFSEVTQGEQAPALDGAYTIEQALDALLAGTGLVHETLDEDGQSVTVRRPAPTVGQRRKGIEEIIVTGQKREERIQDVPIAISAFTQEDLTVSQIAGGPDLHLQVPNMTFTKTNFTGYSIQIRGIGTQAISATTDPAVAVALNQTPFIRNRFFEQEFFDMERVEVLRGPQGTLFGRNATAGVVNLITAKPKFQHESMLSYDRGNYDSQRWEAMVNLPIVDDRMALRIAGAGTRRDGYATNEITDSPIDGRDLWSSRVSLRFAPNDRLDVNLIWEHFEEEDDRLRSGKQLCAKDVVTEVGGIEVETFDQHLETAGQGADWIAVQPRFSQGCTRESLYSNASFQTPNGASVPYYVPLEALGAARSRFDPYASQVQSRDLRTIESTVDPIYRARSDIGQIQIDYQLTDALLLESETAYSTDEIYSLQDFNRFNTAPQAWSTTTGVGQHAVELGVLDENGFFCDPQIGCADRLVAVDVSTAESSQFSQELRVSSQLDGPFNFSVGANFLRYDTEDKYYVFINSLTMAAANAFLGNQDAEDLIFPYVAGETSFEECLFYDRLPLDPLSTYPFGCIYIEPNSIENIQDEGHNYFLSKNPYNLRSYAVFGETYWNITDALKLTAGLRWSVDKKSAPRIPSWAFAGNTIGYPTLEVVEQEWREPTGRLVLDWKPNLDFTDETLVYGSVSRGYKAGGSNPPPYVAVGVSAESFGGISSSITRPKTFDAEFVNAFELGTKNTLADGAVTLNMTAFYYDYQGYQISEIVDRAAFNRNFDAEVWGGEIEADWWVSESLRLGFKGGYQRTKIADGERAVDLIDRTAGGEHLYVTDVPNPNYTGTPGEGRSVSDYVTDVPLDELPADQEYFAYGQWSVARPWPVFPSSCVLPTFLFANYGELYDLGQGGGSATGGCIYAYFSGVDPVTNLPYVPQPEDTAGGFSAGGWEGLYGALNDGIPSTYPGFNPAGIQSPIEGYENPSFNNGEGFTKDLSGNEFPNAPHYTLTFKADYLVPLRGDWMMTAHTDIYWQSKSWWRIFNDHEYNRLEDYFTMNLAAIFTNDVSGWNIMAYVKNVTDETAITGAFLGSDDTGLTSNVFLTEPRLYGIRVTKRWSDGGGPAEWIGAGTSALLGKEPGEPSPWLLTMGGQMLRPNDSQNEVFAPEFNAAFDPNIDPTSHQGWDMDWGDGREIELTYAPENGWRFSLGVRSGESDFDDRETQLGETFTGCAFPGYVCERDDLSNYYESTTNFLRVNQYRTNYSVSDLTETEDHLLVDFAVGRDVGLGALEGVVSAGLRYARFESRSNVSFTGQPDWVLPEDCAFGELFTPCGKYNHPAQHTEIEAEMEAEREFEGLGPVVGFEGSSRLFGDARGGHVDLDFSLSAGVLFGRQETEVTGFTSEAYFDQALPRNTGDAILSELDPDSLYATTFDYERDDDGIEVVPTLGVGLGLSYRIDSGSISAGYSWERYYGAIDGGIEERKVYDRTVDGPYLKVTFGGGS